MSLSGTTNTYLPPTLDGLNIIEADEIYINGIPINTENLVPYTNATKNVNLGTFNFQTLGSITAKQHVFPSFGSTIMTGAMTSSIFYADAWEFNNTIQISSLGSGAFLSTSYLRLADGSNNSTLLTLQSDGIADFGKSIPRASTLATGNYDLVNLSTLSNAVSYLEGITSLNFVPYTGSLNNLDMGGSTIKTTGYVSTAYLTLSEATNSEAWTLYTLSTMGNLSTLGGLVIQEKGGNSVYLTGGVVGAKNFQFSSPGGGNAGKVVCTDGNSVMSTTISAGQLQYINALHSNAGGVGETNTWSNTQTFSVAPTLNGLTSATPSFALGINGGNQVVSFAVPTATNILPLANVFTNTNTFNSTLTTAVGETTSINGALTTSLVDLGFTSASFTTAGITGAYTPPLGTITNPSGSTYQITQTAQARSIMAISGFTPSVGITYIFQFNINCTIGTATISVEQNNILRSPALYQLTTGFNVVKGSFTYDGTPNTVVFKIYAGVASWNAQWDSFTLSTYSIGMNADMNALTVNNRFSQRYNALPGDVSTLVNRATMDATIASQSIVNLSNTFIGATNTFNNDVYLGTSTIVVNQSTIATSILQTAGISSQALGGTAVISGSYLLTPTPTTFAYASVYSPTQTFLANAKHTYLFTGFTAGIFGVSLTVYQANVANTGFVAISSTTPVVVGTFSGVFTPNINSSYLGQVYFTFSGINNKTVGWTAFTYQRGQETVNGNLTVNGDTTLANITSSGTIRKNTSNPNSWMTIAGGNGFNSPVLESWFGSLRRGYLGNATASIFQLASENNCDFNLITGGSVRMTIDNAGITTIPSRELRVSNTTSSAGGQIRLTYGTSGTGIGTMLYNDGAGFFILLTNNNDANGNFNSLRPFNITQSSGAVNMENGFGPGYSRFIYSPETAGATYGSICVKGSGRNGWAGYSIYNDSNQQVSFMMNNTAQSHGIYNAPASLWSLYVDVPNGITYLQNVVGNTPISFGPGSWNTGGGGYTLITRTLGNNTSALAFGTSPNRGVIISLTAGIVWNELILSAGTIYTSCFGTINNYTNGGGWVFVSDKRVKKDIKDIKTARSLERIMALKPKTYKKIYPENSETPIPQEVIDADHVGFLAQDVMETNPHCVSGWVDDNCVCDGDDGKRLGINYGDINIHMVGAIQELKKQNDKQQEQIEDLRAYKTLSDERFEKTGRLIADQQKLLEFLMAKLK